MNKTAIRNYAVWARTALIEAVTQKAFEYEIKDGAEMNGALESIGGRLLSSEEREWRRILIEEIRSKGFNQVMEEAAYTWFNRFIALRFMEVNGFIPSRVRVFTNENGEFKPDILKEAMTIEIEGLDRSKVIDLIEKQNNEELFKYLIITQCNALNQGLPYMFEKISNWTELLFPANLLRADSIIGRMVNEIPEEDWQDAVQIIGWMYQYYNTELKDDTFAKLKKNIKISKERIPAATQLFTPDWIVRYMVENSLGRIYMNYKLGMRSEELSEGERIAVEKEIAETMGWKYYLPEAEQEPEVREQLLIANSSFLTDFDLKNIKIIDPCMGSGHILVYAFDVLMQIYTANGYSERDAVESILQNNLYGLDIDDRAGQLAYFAVMMKARKYSRRILNSGITPNVLAIQDSHFMSEDFIEFVANRDDKLNDDLTEIRSIFMDAKEYGSILNVPAFDFEKLYLRIDEIRNYFPENMFEMKYKEIALEKLYPLVKQAEMMHQQYDIVVTNPPYMGASGMSYKLNDFVKNQYPDTKFDISTVFMEKTVQMCNATGYVSMINIPVWMFLSSYERLRMRIIHENTIISMVHPGRGIFGSDFGTTSFVICKKNIKGYCGVYRRLFDVQGEVKSISEREKSFISGKGKYIYQQNDFLKIPGAPIAYWASARVVHAFALCPPLVEIAKPRVGLQTSNNERFIRFWYEVEHPKMRFGISSGEETKVSGGKWFPHNKGGEFRKWYGNNINVVDYENDGFNIKTEKAENLRLGLIEKKNSQCWNSEYYFRESLTWSRISSSNFGIRYSPQGSVFDTAGTCIFADSQTLKYLLGFLSTKVVSSLLQMINPTITFQTGDISKLPVHKERELEVEESVDSAISISKDDWDSFETSWDFKKHPLI